MEMTYDGALVMPNSYALMQEDEMTYIEGGGYVGVTVKLPKAVINMGAVLGAAFAAGYVGWYCKGLAALGPAGAGAAAVITAAVSGVVGYAIKKKYKSVDIGTRVPFLSWHKTIDLNKYI